MAWSEAGPTRGQARALHALRHPSAAPDPTGETLLIWGGSTSVGSNAIQLAVAAGYNEVSRVVYEDFLPQALADGRYVAAPEPAVVGTGLERVQAGFDAQKQGVSAKKVVVSL